MIRLFAFTISVLVLAATSQAQERPPIFQQMFKAYGFESFGQIEKIRYTFNVEPDFFLAAGNGNPRRT